MTWLPEAKPPPTWVPNHTEATVNAAAHELLAVLLFMMTLLLYLFSSINTPPPASELLNSTQGLGKNVCSLLKSKQNPAAHQELYDKTIPLATGLGRREKYLPKTASSVAALKIPDIPPADVYGIVLCSMGFCIIRATFYLPI